MYPLCTTPLPSTSAFVPRPIPTFQPIAPAASSEAVKTHPTNGQQSAETSPGSSLPCGQWTLMDSATHYLKTHHHSQLCSHNLLCHRPTFQIRHTHKPKTHYNHPLLHNTSNNHLLGQILICPPSLSFQLQRHNLCPAHHSNMSLNLQMVKE